MKFRRKIIIVSLIVFIISLSFSCYSCKPSMIPFFVASVIICFFSLLVSVFNIAFSIERHLDDLNTQDIRDKIALRNAKKDIDRLEKDINKILS